MSRKIRIHDRFIIRFIGGLFLILKGFRVKDRYKAAKGEKIVVLSNHTTDFDPMFVRKCTNRFCYTLATDNILSSRIGRFFLPRLGAIPKRKGVTDINSVKTMMSIASKGGSITIFPEGNRSYCLSQYYLSEDLAALLKKFQSTIVIFNIVGGFGNYPRFSKNRRKGPLYSKLRKVLKYEEYKDMPNEELNKIIATNLEYFDLERQHTYKSKSKAEYLERMFFVCPKCGAVSSLHSKGNILKCDKCGLEVKYNEDLTLSSTDPAFKFKELSEWYFYQKDFVKNMTIGDGVIFTDEDVTLSTVNPYVLSKDLAKGKMTLTKDTLQIGGYKIDIKDILIASPVSGRKLVFTIEKDNYRIKGNMRFNALKYVLMFNKLDTKMKLEKRDNYYTL